MGHFSKECKSGSGSASKFHRKPTVSTAISGPTIATIPLTRSSIQITVNGKGVQALIDSGSTDSFIHPAVVNRLKLVTRPAEMSINMASTSLSKVSVRTCRVTIELKMVTATRRYSYVCCQTSV